VFSCDFSVFMNILNVLSVVIGIMNDDYVLTGLDKC